MSLGFIYTALAALSWAISISLRRLVLTQGETVYNLVFWATLVAAPYWFYFLYRKRKELKAATRTDYSILLAMGLISGAIFRLVQGFALQYSQSVNYAFLIRTVIVFTIVFGAVLLKEAITTKKLVLASLTLVGAYLLATNGRSLALSFGDLLTLGAAALIALGHNILGKIATNRMTPILSASGTFVTGFVPLILLVLVYGNITAPVQPGIILALALSSILITRLRFAALKHASAAYVAMIFSFTPVFVLLIAIPFLGERLTAIQILGGSIIIASGMLVEKLKI